jgi:hypothetical protein
MSTLYKWYQHRTRGKGRDTIESRGDGHKPKINSPIGAKTLTNKEFSSQNSATGVPCLMINGSRRYAKCRSCRGIAITSATGIARKVSPEEPREKPCIPENTSGKASKKE